LQGGGLFRGKIRFHCVDIRLDQLFKGSLTKLGIDLVGRVSEGEESIRGNDVVKRVVFALSRIPSNEVLRSFP